MTKLDKLAKEIKLIPGASLWDKNNNDKDSYNFIELKNYDNNSIEQTKKIINKYNYEIVSEKESEGSDYLAYLIFIK